MADKKDRKTPFKIDKKEYKILESQNPVTGSYLRDLPPVPEDYDLWLRGLGSEDDRLINLEDNVYVKNGDHFFTSKKVVTPGGRNK